MKYNTWQRVILLLALLIGIALRMVRSQDIPPGLYRDEAYTGIDGLATLREGPRLFYPVSFGREPLFTWLVAASIGIWGASPFAVRFPSMVVGVSVLIALYLAARELWGERIAALSASVLSVMLWHVLISRVSFRAALVPLFASLGVWQVTRGIKTGKQRFWVMGGIASGVLLYTYLAARAAALPALLMLIYTWRRQGNLRRPSLKNLLSFAIPALIVMTPLLTYTALHPTEVFQRTGNVASVLNSETPWTMLWENVKGAAGMFVMRGDYLSRHNLPSRPVFDPALGAMFVLGAVIALRRFKTDYAAAFLIFWVSAMLLPMVLAEKAPHVLRGVGVLPFLAVFPALGLDWLWRKLHHRSRILGGIVVAVPLLIGFVSTSRDYFVTYPEVTDLCFRFECAGSQLASEVNAYLEQGWTQGSWSASPGPVRSDRQVFVQYQLWKDVVNAHYLIPDTGSFSVPGDPAIDSSPPDPNLPMVYYGWYNRHYPDRWREDMRAWLPPNARIELTEGPLTITQQDKEPHPAYLRFAAEPAELPATRLADLEYGLSLVESCADVTEPEVVMRLVWYAGEVPPVGFSVFLHYERDGEIIAQADGEPGLGHYPMTAWRPGDQFVDMRRLPISDIQPEDRIYAGLYFYATGDRVKVLSAATAMDSNRVRLSLEACDG
ncbi:MAG: glycosyltransferase family 39 protein [Anaerolineae bacterium]|nr:glycosyltransferase family 39 protein [Anaerolineae bacterium]